MKSGLIKAFILGMGITMLSSGMAFASTEEVSPDNIVAPDAVIYNVTGVASSEPGQVDPIDPNVYATGVVGSGQDTPAANPVKIDEALLQKQREIDEYLFKQHREEIEAKGIFVTHTAPVDGIVQIGITPFNDENAQTIYGMVGKDLVLVVEGQRAQILDKEPVIDDGIRTVGAPAGEAADDSNLVSAPDGGDFKIVSVAENAAVVKAESNSPMIWTYAIGVLIVLASAVFMMKRNRAAAKR